MENLTEQTSKPENTTTQTEVVKPVRDVKSAAKPVIIGKKSLNDYVKTALIGLATAPAVKIMARGSNISLAVDVANTLTNKSEDTNYSIESTEIDSLEQPSKDGKYEKKRVSSIEILVIRNQ